jgi:hypothetical protein
MAARAICMNNKSIAGSSQFFRSTIGGSMTMTITKKTTKGRQRMFHCGELAGRKLDSLLFYLFDNALHFQETKETP